MIINIALVFLSEGNTLSSKPNFLPLMQSNSFLKWLKITLPNVSLVVAHAHSPSLFSPLFSSLLFNLLVLFLAGPRILPHPRPSLSSCSSSALPLSFSSSPLCSWATPVDALHLILIKVAKGKGLGVVTDGWERQWMWGEMARDGFHKSLSLVCIKCFLIFSNVLCTTILF